MRPISVRVIQIALLVLVFVTRTDLVLADFNATSSSSEPQSVSSTRWSAIAGSSQLSIETGSAYGPNTPFTSGCSGVPTYVITTDNAGWDISGQTVRLQSQGWNSAVAPGMTVKGSGIINSGVNTITSVNTSAREITLQTAGNSSPANTKLTIGVTTTSCCVVNDFFLTTDGNGWQSTGKRVGLQESTSQLSVGMTVTGVGISSSGLNTISSFSSGNRVNLTIGGNTTPNFTVLKFSSTCNSTSGSQYFDVINTGSLDLNSFNIRQTTTTTNGRSISLQVCSETWDEVSDTCPGIISLVMTTIGSGSGANSPQTINWTQSLLVGHSVRIRATSNESGKSSTIAIWVSNENVRASTDTND